MPYISRRGGMMERNFVKDIIEKMPKDLTDMEKARYIYLEVCRFFVYDPEYLIANNDRKAEIFGEDIDIESVLKNEAVCSKISRAYMYLLDYVGIKNNGIYISNNYEGHLEVAAEINGKVYDMNPTADLMNVKLGYETKHFAENVSFMSNPKVRGFAFLKKKDLKAIDDKLGYTYRLNDEYLKTHKISDFENYTVYMDEAETTIRHEFWDRKKVKDYIKSKHPEVSVDTLLNADITKYKMEFLVDYINNFAKDLQKIDKRDLLERLADNTIEKKGKAYEIFNGIVDEKEAVSILRCNGLCGNEDVFYKIKDNSDIEKLDVNQMKDFIESGFKTFKVGKEQRILRLDNPFQDIIAKYYRKLNNYYRAEEDPEKQKRRHRRIISMKYLQDCKHFIAQVDEYINSGDIDTNKLIGINNAFSKFSKYSGVDIIDPNDPSQRKKCDCMLLRTKMVELERKLSDDALPVILVMEKCRKEIKDRALERGVKLYHLSKIAPEEYKDAKIGAQGGYNSFGTTYGKYVDASTRKLDTNIEKLSIPNNGEVYVLPHIPNAYFLDANNVHIEENAGSKKAMLNNPGYVYYMDLKDFYPDIGYEYNFDAVEYGITFNGEWLHNGDIDIPKNVESYRDVTSVLNRNQVILNVNVPKEEIHFNNVETAEKLKNTIIENIKEEKICYLNGEVNVNDLHLLDELKPKVDLVYDANALMNANPIKTPEQVAVQKHALEEFVKNALNRGVSKSEYDIQKRMKDVEDINDNNKNK